MFRHNAKDYNCDGFEKTVISHYVCLLTIAFTSPFLYSILHKFKGSMKRESWFVCPKRAQAQPGLSNKGRREQSSSFAMI